MKKLIPIIFAVACFSFQTASAQNRNDQDTMRNYFNRLAASKDEAGKALLREKLYGLLQSGKEEDWNTAANFFYSMKRSVSDSIRKATLVKFPMGTGVRGAETDTIYKQKDPVKKEAMYKAWIKKFPPEQYGPDRIQYDYVRNAVASAYAEAGNVKKAVAYANMTETGVWKGEGYAGPAIRLQKDGHTAEALALYKKAIANARKYRTTNRSDYGAQFAATGYPGYNNYVAEILIGQKKYAEALPYLKEAHDSAQAVRANVNANYAKALMALGRNEEAFEKINEAVTAGQTTQEMKEMLKTLYAKVKGSDAGYDEYMAALNKQLAEKVRQDLTKQMINVPAAAFTLKDVDGKSVSLADYKGKTVVLDFWATWCGPCKRSFPAMKKAMAKFKEDDGVKFLFIHTLEHEPAASATVAAKKYVNDNNLPFDVLMDTVDPEAGVNKTATDYKVEGIPTKFVIDRNGNIRFRIMGLNGSDEMVVEEVAAMIELANK